MAYNIIMKNGDAETVLMELPTLAEVDGIVKKMEAAGLKAGESIIWRQKEGETPQGESNQRFPDSDTTLAEALQEAREGAKENLRVMGDLAGNVDAVLEVKKDHLKTKAYIKVLEEAYAQSIRDMPRQTLNGKPVALTEDRIDGSGGTNIFIEDPDTGVPSAFYYVKPKKSVKKETAKAAFWVLGLGNAGFWFAWEYGTGVVLMSGVAVGIIVALYFGTLKWLNHLANDKKRQRKEYEKEKRFVAMVRANGMFVPFPGHKQDYRIALNFVESYERAYPAEYEPHRLWLTPEEFSYYSNMALNKGRKPMI